jgi:Ca2+-binding RTX toxin-like protein
MAIINGTAGADTINGLAGNDTIYGRAGNDRLYGRLGADVLYGEAGDDLLDGGAGGDTMEGGAGNDAYYVDSLADIIRETAAGAAGGNDTVYVSVDFTLGANLEKLTMYGSARRGEGNTLANVITGNGGANELFGRLGRDTLIGNAGDDLLDGGADIDRMEGGAGNDAYYVDNASDVTIESTAGAAGGVDTVNASVNRTLGANLENLRLYGGATVGTGNGLANAITGNVGNNALSGLDGNDTLVGGLGDDRLLGGAGNDSLLGGLPDWSGSWDSDDGAYPEVVEDGKDTIDGGAGTDTVVFGVTSYDEWRSWSQYFDPDLHIDLSGGTVTYLSHGFSQDKLVSIENVTASSGDDVIVGTGGANVIRAGYGRNVVESGGGNDTIFGGAMGDQIWPEGVVEVLSGGSGNDVIYSNGSTLNPYDGRESAVWAEDYISGGAGNDRLVSGFGHIRMTGGSGADIFEVSSGAWVDDFDGNWYDLRGVYTRIKDFSRVEGDKIYVDMVEDEWIGVFDGVPDFVGQADGLETGELGYRRETSASGGTDTVIELMLAQSYWVGGARIGCKDDDALGGLLRRHPADRLRVHLTAKARPRGAGSDREAQRDHQVSAQILRPDVEDRLLVWALGIRTGRSGREFVVTGPMGIPSALRPSSAPSTVPRP